MHRLALKARYVVPVDGPPISDGVVVLAGAWIAAIGRSAGTAALCDLGNVALLPGLVNAHTHLEFSGLRRPLGLPGTGLVDWIRGVLAWRAQQQTDPAVAIASGLRQCAVAGTTTVGDMVAGPPAAAAWRGAHADLTLFFETMALSRARIDEAIGDVQRKVAQTPPTRNRRPGIGPHAPYTVHPQLLVRLTRLSADRRLALALHLAESREELRLLRIADGPLRDLLIERDVWDSAAIPRGTRPLDYLRHMGHAWRALIVHGNYLDDEELGYLSLHAGRMALVYCPRTHASFCHDPYPLAKALALGVHVALGTDGRASNPDLSLLEEMRHIVRHHPQVAPETVLRLGTECGAEALGRRRWTGSITPGKLANLTAVALPEGNTGDVYEAVLGGTGRVQETWFCGRPAAVGTETAGSGSA